MANGNVVVDALTDQLYRLGKIYTWESIYKNNDTNSNDPRSIMKTVETYLKDKIKRLETDAQHERQKLVHFKEIFGAWEELS